MKFVGFDDKGEIGNVVIVDYHIDEMGFSSSAWLSLSLWVSDHWWRIVIIVNDGKAAPMSMYMGNRVRWCIIIINDGTPSLRCPLHCIGGQYRS